MSSETPGSIPPAKSGGSGNKINLSVDLRLVVIALLVIIGIMIALWRPWQSRVGADSRTITVTGGATLKATPDEYVFNPTYEFKNADKDVALKALTAKSEEVTAGLKKVGVADNKIKTDSNGYERGAYYYGYDASSKGYTYSLNLTVTVNDQKIVQKVQDYLVSTGPTGSVSPYTAFSDAKQKELDSRARDEATKEARAKADQSAKNLGFKVGSVKSVEDTGFAGDVRSYLTQGSALEMGAPEEAASSLQVQPGENELEYSVTVIYYVR